MRMMREDSKDLKNILEKMSGGEALAIINILAEDQDIAAKIESIAIGRLSDVDVEDVASDLFSDLNFLDVEDVWHNSGGTRDGYVDPDELASEMFDDVLEPYLCETN